MRESIFILVYSMSYVGKDGEMKIFQINNIQRKGNSLSGAYKIQLIKKGI